MKKLIALISIVSLNAFSATSTLQFNGTVATTCAFSSQVNGALGVDASAPALLSTTAATGTAGQVTLTYFGTPTMSVEEVQGFTTKPSGVNNGDFTYTTHVTSSAGKTYTSSGGFLTYNYASGSTDTLNIDLQATKSSGNVPLGSYSAASALTCQ